MAKKKDRYLELRGNTYYFRKRHNGKNIKKSLNTTHRQTARDLRDFYLSNLLEYGQLETFKDEKDDITFGSVAKEWASIHKTQVKYSTWPDYVSAMNGHILPRFKDDPISEITYVDILKFRSRMEVGNKRANNIMVPMKSVFDFAHRQGIIQDNVMIKIKRLPEEAPEIHPFTLDEVKHILDTVDSWYRPYLTVAFFTGMRAGELNAMDWSDFLENMKPEPHLFIHKTYVYKKEGAPKTRKSKRYITCLPLVLEALTEQRKLTGHQKHIFLTKDGRRITPDHIRKEVWMPVLEKIGIEYRPPLQTRHTFATLMLSAGEDVGWVQNMMGHSSLQMIFERYYAWIPKPTRLDGQAFTRYAEGTIDKTSPKAMSTEIEPEKPISENKCPKIVPLDEYRQKNRA